jgi:MATE family multidrug resistance protein
MKPHLSPLDRPILRLALPSLVASLSVPFIGIVDTALVGHLPDVAFMGAVSVASVIFDVLY